MKKSTSIILGIIMLVSAWSVYFAIPTATCSWLDIALLGIPCLAKKLVTGSLKYALLVGLIFGGLYLITTNAFRRGAGKVMGVIPKTGKVIGKGARKTKEWFGKWN